MFNRKSIYALNKKDPDAIVYIQSRSFRISGMSVLKVRVSDSDSASTVPLTKQATMISR